MSNSLLPLSYITTYSDDLRLISSDNLTSGISITHSNSLNVIVRESNLN